jgi:hypothetical protein
LNAGPLTDKYLLDTRHDVARVAPEFVGINRDVTPTQQSQSFVLNHLFNELLTLDACFGLGRQEHYASTIFARLGQFHAQERANSLKELVRHLNQYASAISGFGVAAAGASVSQVDQDFQRLVNYLVRLDAFDVGYHAHAAAIVLRCWGVQSALG